MVEMDDTCESSGNLILCQTLD